MNDLILRHDSGGICTLTLNSPGNLNALSDEMLAALQAQLDDLAGDRDSKVVVLKGAGKVFCAGHDLKQMTAGRDAADGGAAYFHDLFTRCGHLMQSLTRIPQPVIAQVHGIATAAGCQLVASCDLAIATESTRFGVNGINIGLFCATPMVALTRNIGRKQAFEMLTTGDFITAERAAELGLINHAVAADGLENAVNALAGKLAAKMDGALKIGKSAFYDQLQLPLDQAYDFTAEVMAQNMMMRDTAEGIEAFLQKRDPDWKT
ncbi:MAG: enoyl-CoA hydratase [Rhodobacterales bacterium]|nr:MAG: enoyl-CoA hydratase [Rhodobacterales bacterium]